MAIADTIASMQTHTSNAYNMIEYGTDLTGTNKNLENLSTSIFKAFIQSLNNPDTLWGNLPKITGTGTNISLNNTIEAPMKIELSASELSQAGTPTPSSPQDIHTISGNNTISICGKNMAFTNWASDFVTACNNVNVYLTTKNDRNCLHYNPSAGYGDYDNKNLSLGIKFKENTQYTISYDILKETDTSKTIAIYYTDGTSTTNNNLANTDIWVHQTITSTANKTIKYIAPYYTSGYTYIDINTYQIEEGTTATTYEPYKGTDYIINLDTIEYCKIGNYEDRIFKNISGDTDYSSEREDGAWYIKKNIIKRIFTGAVDEGWEMESTSKFRLPFNNTIFTDRKLFSTSFEGMLCNYYEVKGSGDYYIRWRGSNEYNIYIYNKDITSVSDFTTWLGTHNVIIDYVLNTPTYTKITGTLAEQLEAIWKAQSKDGQTNISQVNNDLPFGMNVGALENIGG